MYNNRTDNSKVDRMAIHKIINGKPSCLKLFNLVPMEYFRLAHLKNKIS